MWLVASLFTGCKNGSSQPRLAADGQHLVDSARSLYKQARAEQNAGTPERAIPLFRRCLHVDSPDTMVQWALQPVLNDALLQMFNSYQSLGQTDECLRTLSTLTDRPTQTLQNYSWRDLNSIKAYAMAMAEGHDREAESLIAYTLSLPLKGMVSTTDDEGDSHNLRAERLFRDYSYAAAICYSNLARQQQVVAWSKKAIAVSDKCGKISGTQYICSLLSSVYQRQGNMPEAIRLSEKAVDYAESLKDTLSVVNAYNVLARIFLDLNLTELANVSATRGLNYLLQLKEVNPMIATQTYVQKSKALYALGRKDSCMLMLRRAYSTCRSLPYNNGMSDVDYQAGIILVASTHAQHRQRGIQYLQHVAREATPMVRARAYYGLAQGYQAQGNRAACEAALDSMYRLEHSATSPNLVSGASSFAVSFHLSTDNSQKLAKFAADLQTEYKNRDAQNVMQRVAEDVAHENMRKERLALQREQSELQQRHWLLLSSVAMLLFVLISLFYIYMRKKARHRREKLQLREEIDEKEKQISETSERMQSMQQTYQSLQRLEQLGSSLQTSADVRRFEQYFAQAYPKLEQRIAQYADLLSQKEILLIKLHFAKLSNAQISQSLGIALRSVTVYRYRIRQKLHLQDESLDDFFMSHAESKGQSHITQTDNAR